MKPLKAPLEKGSKKLINAWAFYDWANSVYSLVISSAIFPIYYGVLFSEINTIPFFGYTTESHTTKFRGAHPPCYPRQLSADSGCLRPSPRCGGQPGAQSFSSILSWIVRSRASRSRRSRVRARQTRIIAAKSRQPRL